MFDYLCISHSNTIAITLHCPGTSWTVTLGEQGGAAMSLSILGGAIPQDTWPQV